MPLANPINDSIWRACRAGGSVNIAYGTWFANYKHRHEFEVIDMVDEDGAEPTVVLAISRAYRELLEDVESVKGEEDGPINGDDERSGGVLSVRSVPGGTAAD